MSSPTSPYLRPKRSEEKTLPSIGTMNFGRRTPAAEAHKIVHRAIERGAGLFDVANVYENGESEKILGAALKEKRGDVLVATKVGLHRPSGKVEGLSKTAITAACDASLERLGIDVIDLYYLHAPDWDTPIEETLMAIFDLRAKGKIRHFGVSNFASWQILEIFALCDAAQQERPLVAQQMYNLLIRQLDVEYFKFTKKHSIHTTTYNALAGGLLARPHSKDEIPKGSRFDKNPMYQRRYWSQHFFDFKAALEDLAKDAGMSLADLAYAWIASRPGADSILIGAASVEHLDQALDAIQEPVSPETAKKIDALSHELAGTDATYCR